MKNKDIIIKFYTSFANANAQEMINCYHNNIEFEDPAFGKLKGKDAKNMWRMLLSRNKNIKITFSNVQANEKTGTAKWKAVYFYGQKKRKVINNINASFQFKDGKISKHTDKFSMYKWSKQALGFTGFLLGSTPFLKKKVQKLTNKLLQEYNKVTV